jgi:hypothetical protein
MSKVCSRKDECHGTVGCKGCGFQHFDLIDDSQDPAIRFIKDEYFILCSQKRKGPGGRVALDAPFKKFILEKAKDIIPDFPVLKELQPKDLTDKINIGGHDYQFQLKCDGAFSFNDRYIFYEIKGYGDDTNSILSAITAAQLSTYIKKFKDHKYYYLGGNSSIAKTGLKREEHFLLEKRYKVAPYIKWAEEKGFIKFYGIADLRDMLNDIKQYCEQVQMEEGKIKNG